MVLTTALFSVNVPLAPMSVSAVAIVLLFLVVLAFVAVRLKNRKRQEYQTED